MPVSTVLTVHRYKPGAAMLPEPIPFPYLSASDLVVTHIAAINGVQTELAAGYVIAGDGAAKAGTIQAIQAWPADDVIEIARRTALIQDAEVLPHQPVPAVALTRQLDRMAMAAQERRADADDLAGRVPYIPKDRNVRRLFPRVTALGDWEFTEAGPGATGPADNTYTTLADLLASDPTRKSARLVPEAGETEPAGNFSYIGGQWRRQQAPGIQTSAGRSLQRRIEDVAGLADKLEIDDFDDVKVAAEMAFTLANPSQGRGVTLRAPRRAMFLYEPLLIPSLVTIVGGGYRDTFFIPQFDGPMFIFDSVVLSGLRDCRIGLGNGKNVCAIDIRTTTGSTRTLNFRDLEIVGGGPAGAKSGDNGGQTAVRAFTSGNRIITECVFDRLIMSEIDRPVVMAGPEGNDFTRFVIDQYGYSGQCGMELVTHADYFQGRIAGAPAAGTIAFKQGGFRNQAMLRVDSGNGALAIDLAQNAGNQVMLQRPFEAGPPTIQTPVGNFRAGNTLIDGYRVHDLGPAPSVANFVAEGFGDGAVVDGITGHDKSVRFTIHAGTANFGVPQVSYSFAGGPWPYNNAIVSVSRNGGNQNDRKPSGASASTNGWGFAANVVPVAGESYVFQVGVC